MNGNILISWKTIALTLVAMNLGVVIGYVAKSYASLEPEVRAEAGDAAEVSEIAGAGKSSYILSCEEDAVSKDYVSQERINQLSAGAMKDPNSVFSKFLTTGERSVITDAINAGAGNAFYSARIVRSYSIAEAMDEHITCLKENTSECTVPAVISHFSKNITTGKNMTLNDWTQKRDEWIGFTKKDVQAGSHCLGS